MFIKHYTKVGNYQLIYYLPTLSSVHVIPEFLLNISYDFH